MPDAHPIALSSRMLLRYGVLGLPLAFAGLPLYVHVPKFYADILHMDLGALGRLLLALRLCDAVTDPVIGMACDRLHRNRRAVMAACVPPFIAGYAALFNPPAWAFLHPALWLSGCLFIVYFSFSTLMINYYAQGVGMARQYHDHTRIAAFREGCMLLGVLLASVLPTVLLQHFTPRAAYALFSLLPAPLLILCAWLCLSLRTAPATAGAMEKPAALFASLARLLADNLVRCVLIVAFFNAIPAAITATLFLFFTQDILHASAYSGPLLGLYFLSAACGMPLWMRLSLAWGKKFTLLFAMAAAIACFIWAFLLGAGDIWPFAAICALSGITLGADSMLLPSMLGDALAGRQEGAATGFGLWNFTNKLTMAFAAGIVLPLLGASGYHSDATHSVQSLQMLSVCYALVPCGFKAIAALLLYCSPLDHRKTV